MIRHPAEPAGLAFFEHDQPWLWDQRAQHSQLNTGGVTSRTKTRAHRSRVLRWNQNGWLDQLGVQGSEDPKQLKMATLTLLKNLGLQSVAKKAQDFCKL